MVAQEAYTAIPALYEYAAQNDGFFPPVDFSEGGLMLGLKSGETSLSAQQVQSARKDFYYLGYLVIDETDLETFEAAVNAMLSRGESFSADLEVGEGKGNFGTSKIYRLKKDLALCIAEELGVDPDEIGKHLHNVPILFEVPEPKRWSFSGVEGTSLTVGRWAPGYFPYTGASMKSFARLRALKAGIDEP